MMSIAQGESAKGWKEGYLFLHELKSNRQKKAGLHMKYFSFVKLEKDEERGGWGADGWRHSWYSGFTYRVPLEWHRALLLTVIWLHQNLQYYHHSSPYQWHLQEIMQEGIAVIISGEHTGKTFELTQQFYCSSQPLSIMHALNLVKSSSSINLTWALGRVAFSMTPFTNHQGDLNSGREPPDETLPLLRES